MDYGDDFWKIRGVCKYSILDTHYDINTKNKNLTATEYKFQPEVHPACKTVWGKTFWKQPEKMIKDDVFISKEYE